MTRTSSICSSYGETLHLQLLLRMFLAILIFNIIYWLLLLYTLNTF